MQVLSSHQPQCLAALGRNNAPLGGLSRRSILLPQSTTESRYASELTPWASHEENAYFLRVFVTHTRLLATHRPLRETRCIADNRPSLGKGPRGKVLLHARHEHVHTGGRMQHPQPRRIGLLAQVITPSADRIRCGLPSRSAGDEMTTRGLLLLINTHRFERVTWPAVEKVFVTRQFKHRTTIAYAQ